MLALTSATPPGTAHCFGWHLLTPDPLNIFHSTGQGAWVRVRLSLSVSISVFHFYPSTSLGPNKAQCEMAWSLLPLIAWPL